MIESGKYLRYWDEIVNAPYLWNASENIFVACKDPESISNKAQFIKKQKMAGAMYWDYIQDLEESALLNAIYSGFNSP